MKKSVFLSVFAFTFAIVLSSFTVNNVPSQIGYWDNPFIPGIQSGQVDCAVNVSQVNCLESGYQVYDEPALTTPLKKNP